MPRVSMDITLEAEYRGAHWACFVPELGFTVYGETRADAEHEVNHALEALLGSFHGDLDGIAGYLTRYDVLYSIHHGAESEPAQAGGATRRVQIEVPVAA